MRIHNRYFVEWRESYSVGVQDIDHQHRFLILKILDLQEAMASGTTGAILTPLVHNLVTYTRYHFSYEARLYAERGYGGIRRHLELHAELARQVTELGISLKNNKLRTGAPVMAFLQHWLVDHILGEDMFAFGIRVPGREE
jgi:hemerythrin